MRRVRFTLHVSFYELDVYSTCTTQANMECYRKKLFFLCPSMCKERGKMSVTYIDITNRSIKRENGVVKLDFLVKQGDSS